MNSLSIRTLSIAILFTLASFFMSIPFISVHADEPTTGGPATGNGNQGAGDPATGNGNQGAGGPGAGNGNPGANTNELTNPLHSQSIVEFLLKVVDVVLIFLTPIIIFFIIYAGFLFVTAQGNTSKISEARSAITWAVIGGVVILGAKALITVIENTVKAF